MLDLVLQNYRRYVRLRGNLPKFAINTKQVALTTSGGGYRSLLLGAGVIQGFDSRDSNISTSGLFQALTYQAGLSGGGWLLSSFAGNNYPTITSLKDSLWEQAFQDSLLDPAYLLVAPAYLAVVNDIVDKQVAGFPPTLTDPVCISLAAENYGLGDMWPLLNATSNCYADFNQYGRLLSYQLLYGADGGVSTTLSSVTGFSNFTSHAVPYPIITSRGVKTFLGECSPGPNATQWEFSPYEFGSWDSDVSAFTQTHYLGTSLKSGKPTGALCTANYDNLGYILGTSSNLFNEACLSVPVPQNSTTNLVTTLAQMLDYAHAVAFRDEYAAYPNPFYEYVSRTSKPNSANNITAQQNLSLVDGGEALQNNPIWPFLQPARGVDVMIVNDNSADTANNFPNGSEILTTYVQSISHNLTKMPFIPSVNTFISEGLNKRATFFGCNDTSKITIVWIPNVNYTFASNVPTAQLEYPKSETDAMIANGVQMADQGGKAGWATCLGCALMMKTGQKLPSACQSCYKEYCYYGS